MQVQQLIAAFQTMLREKWRYAYGAASTGEVDCAGAFVWAFRQAGQDIYHGSNRIARAYVKELRPITEVRPGMAAFKLRAPGDSRYALPGIYRAGGSHYSADQNDYYHIGLVDSNPAFVLNAQGSAAGFVRSPITEGWAVCGFLRDVDYGEEAQAEETSGETAVDAGGSAVITLPPEKRGQTVNLRVQPGGAVLRQLRDGTAVRMEAVEGDWALVTAGSVRGYVMRTYLVESAGSAADALTALTLRVTRLEQAVFGELNG